MTMRTADLMLELETRKVFLRTGNEMVPLGDPKIGELQTIAVNDPIPAGIWIVWGQQIDINIPALGQNATPLHPAQLFYSDGTMTPWWSEANIRPVTW
jgi:hypothetical protein